MDAASEGAETAESTAAMAKNVLGGNGHPVFVRDTEADHRRLQWRCKSPAW
jgi:hypothetical protein